VTSCSSQRISPYPAGWRPGRSGWNPSGPGTTHLERHAQDFAERRGFTYTVLSTADDDVIGCVYIYPLPGDSQQGSSAGGQRARVRSWVRADHAALDPVLYRAVLAWLEHSWPFRSIEYAPRP
jgi:hypothetical protein